MHFKSSFKTLGTLLMCVALLVGCAAPVAVPSAAPSAESGEAAPAEAASGGTLLAVETGGTYSLDPFVTPWFTMIMSSLYDALVTTDLDKKDVGHLAESWVTSEDGLTTTFTLREGVTFTDGTPFDAAAAKWNLDHYFDPETGAQVGQNLARLVTSVDVIDDRTVSITTSSPYAPIMTDLGILYMVSPTAYEELGKDEFGLAPVGTGEFILTESIPDSHVAFVKNPDYTWAPDYANNDGPVPADALEIKYLADEAVIYASLETGELNLAPLPGQYLPQAEANPDITIVEGIDWTVWYLGFNNTKAPFDDDAFRQAVSYIVDREEIALAAFDGKVYPLAGPLSPSITGYNQEVEDYALSKSNDPELGMQMLADAGYVDTDGDGVLEKDGVAVEIHLDFPGAAGIQRVAETIQAQLADAGIAMTISQVEAATIADMSNRCEHDAFLRAYGLADATILASLTSPNVGAGNRICMSNPEFDELNKVADGTVDPAARQEAIDAEARWLIDHRGHIPLFAPISNTGYRNEVTGIEFDIVGAAHLYNVAVGN